jgi:hypothetical protein
MSTSKLLLNKLKYVLDKKDLNVNPSYGIPLIIYYMYILERECSNISIQVR